MGAESLRALLAAIGLWAMAVPGPNAHAADGSVRKFRHVPTQFIAALGAPGATSGGGAQSWGLWPLDPGPRGVELSRYGELQKAGGIAPERWKFDRKDWWLEEHGLIMEAPEFPLPPRRYMVTGARGTTAVLTVHPADAKGDRRWELDGGATLYDVTHLGCRSARYRPAGDGLCSPARAPKAAFPVAPGAVMPAVAGCRQQDYAVLIVVAVETDD